MKAEDIKELRDKYKQFKGTKHADLVLQLCNDYETVCKNFQTIIKKIKALKEETI